MKIPTEVATSGAQSHEPEYEHRQHDRKDDHQFQTAGSAKACRGDTGVQQQSQPYHEGDWNSGYRAGDRPDFGSVFGCFSLKISRNTATEQWRESRERESDRDDGTNSCIDSRITVSHGE